MIRKPIREIGLFSGVRHRGSPIGLLKSVRLDFIVAGSHEEVQKGSRSLPDCTSQQKVDTTLYFYTSFNEHNTPYTVLESDNSESMPDVLH